MPAEHPLESDDTSTEADGDGLGAILSSQFVHDSFDVNLDSILGDFQSLADVADIIFRALCMGLRPWWPSLRPHQKRVLRLGAPCG